MPWNPKLDGEKYQYKLSNGNYPTWVPLYKSIGLDPSSFTFRIALTMDGSSDRAGIVFCFGGKENVTFRSNAGSSLNRLMLSMRRQMHAAQGTEVRHPPAGGSGHPGPENDGGDRHPADFLPAREQ